MTTIAPGKPITYRDAAAIAPISVARYQRMIETGILTSSDQVELLENYVVLKMPRNPLHDSTLQQMLRPLLRALPEGWDLRVQSAIALGDSQPEPDFTIVRGAAPNYSTRHPGPSDVALVIEVADSSLQRDQSDKTRIYARGGIPCYWIVNLVDGCIEVFTGPSGPTDDPAYASCQTYRPGDQVPLILEGAVAASVPVDDLLRT